MNKSPGFYRGIVYGVFVLVAVVSTYGFSIKLTGAQSTTPTTPIRLTTLSILAPLANSVLSASQAFTWNEVIGATEYWVTLKKGSITLYDKSTGLNPAVVISNIPQDGSTLTFQVWYKADGRWYESNAIPAKEVIYRAGTTTGGGTMSSTTITIVNPPPSTLLPASQTFTWNAVTGATEYWVTLKKGAMTIYDRTAGANTSVMISNIPQDGSVITFQIWYKAGGRWYASNTTPAKEVRYETGGTTGGTASTTSITVITPSATTLISAAQVFNWNAVSGATEYWVTLKQGTRTLYDRTTGANTQATITNIPQDGSNVTLQIWYKAGGRWYASNTTPAKEVVYTTYTPGGGGGYITTITPPTSNKVSSTQTFSWNQVGTNGTYIACLQTPGIAVQCNLGVKIVQTPSATFTGVPTSQAVTLTIYYANGGVVTNQSFTYTN